MYTIITHLPLLLRPSSPCQTHIRQSPLPPPPPPRQPYHCPRPPHTPSPLGHHCHDHHHHNPTPRHCRCRPGNTPSLYDQFPHNYNTPPPDVSTSPTASPPISTTPVPAVTATPVGTLSPSSAGSKRPCGETHHVDGLGPSIPAGIDSKLDPPSGVAAMEALSTASLLTAL